MYTIRTNERVLDDLTGDVYEKQLKREKRDILHKAIHADRSLLFDIVVGMEEYRVSHAGHFPMLQDADDHEQEIWVLEHVDIVLMHTTPHVMRKLIYYLRRVQQDGFLTESPANSEKRMVYGGSALPTHLELWLHFRRRGDTLFACASTKNKHSIEMVIEATNAPFRTEFETPRGYVDKYDLVPNVFRERVMPWAS